MSGQQPVFPVGSVGYNLMLLRGTWHDHIELYNLDGTPLADDSAAGSGSPAPARSTTWCTSISTVPGCG